MKIKTSELTGAALDWAVARLEGNTFAGEYRHLLVLGFKPPKYSSDWSQGGPIIDREKMDCNAPIQNVPYWTYFYCTPQVGSCARQMHRQTGPAPLIAAMRCYIASKLGDTVEIPDELCK